MTTYQANDLSGLISAFFDPDSPTVTFKKINGVDIDWVALAGAPHVVSLPKGSIRIFQNGKLNPPVYDDGGSVSGHPQTGASLSDGSVTYTLTDGTTEVGPFTMSFTLSGIATLPPPPSLICTVPPSISGANTVGATLTRTAGTWTGNGTPSITGRWTRDDVTIAGQTGATYVTVAGDVGKVIKYVEDATDATPSASSAASNGIGVTPIALANTSAPSFTGTPTVGSTLTYVAGTWTGTPPVTVTLDGWTRDGVLISGATGNTYTLQAADQGKQVALIERGTDAFGSSTVAASSVTVSAAASLNADTEEANLLSLFAAVQDAGWTGFPDETGFTIVVCTHPDQVKAQWDSWRNGTPATSKVKCLLRWNGPLAAAATVWVGVPTAKLSGYVNAAKIFGYDIPPGGFWIDSDVGYDPIWDSLLRIVGPTRLHIGRFRIGGRRAGAPADSTFCLKFERNSTYPVLGCVHFDDVNVGLLDNDPTSVQADRPSGLNFYQGFSFHATKLRIAGVVFGVQQVPEFCMIEQYDLQQWVGDAFYSRNFTGPMNGRTAHLYLRNYLMRDMTYLLTSAHCDGAQLGTGADTNAAYRAFYKNVVAHLRPHPDTGGSQLFYNDDSSASVVIHATAKNVVGGMNATWAFNMYDPSQAGINIIEDFAIYRAGDTCNVAGGGSRQDSQPTINVPHGTANGGKRLITNGTIGETLGGGLASATLTNVRYCSPKRSVPAGNNGLTIATAKRIEEVIVGTVVRDGSDWMTYNATQGLGVIPGEDSADFATAWYAILDFYTPEAGWGTVGQPQDPETWPHAPVRP